MEFLMVISFLLIFASIIGLFFRKTRKHSWKVLLGSILVFIISGFFVEPEQDVTQNQEAKQEKEEKAPATPSNEDKAKEEEYYKYANNLLNRVELALDLINQGYKLWNSEFSIGQVEQGIKELENEVQELDKLEPANSQKELHGEFKEGVINIRDLAKTSLEEAKQDRLGDAKNKINEATNKASNLKSKLDM